MVIAQNFTELTDNSTHSVELTSFTSGHITTSVATDVTNSTEITKSVELTNFPLGPVATSMVTDLTNSTEMTNFTSGTIPTTSVGSGVLGFDCSNLDNGNYPDPKSTPPHCNKFYYSCSSHNVLKLQCPHGLYYDPDHNWCESKANIKVCGGKQRPGASATDIPIVPGKNFVNIFSQPN